MGKGMSFWEYARRTMILDAVRKFANKFYPLETKDPLREKIVSALAKSHSFRQGHSLNESLVQYMKKSLQELTNRALNQINRNENQRSFVKKGVNNDYGKESSQKSQMGQFGKDQSQKVQPQKGGFQESRLRGGCRMIRLNGRYKKEPSVKSREQNGNYGRNLGNIQGNGKMQGSLHAVKGQNFSTVNNQNQGQVSGVRMVR